MKISELIEYLGQIKEIDGDMDVYGTAPYYEPMYSITPNCIGFSTYDFNDNKVFDKFVLVIGPG